MKKSDKFKKRIVFSGIATALITPFRDERVDYRAFERLIERQLDAGIRALVFCGTTGESATLTDEEKIEIFTFAKDLVCDRATLIFGCSTNSHLKTMKMANAACECGADALLCVTPYYNKGTSAGIIASYRELCSLEKSVILYNVPSRTGVDVDTDLLKKLAREPNLCAVKECAGIERISRECFEFSDRLAVYSGNDTELLPSLSVGAAGCISVISNLYPRETREVYDAFVNSENKKALACDKRLFNIKRLLFEETSPAPVKYALSTLGLCEDTLRLPLGSISRKLKKKIDAEMKKISQNI